MQKKIRSFDDLLPRIKKGYFTEVKEELTQTQGSMGYSIALEQSHRGWVTKDPEILKIALITGWTVAHEQAEQGSWNTHFPHILKMKDDNGWSVAHFQAMMNGWTTEDTEILALKNDAGVSVAHIQAGNGWRTNNPDILRLTDKNGRSVAKTLKPIVSQDSENMKLLLDYDFKSHDIAELVTALKASGFKDIPCREYVLNLCIRMDELMADGDSLGSEEFVYYLSDWEVVIPMVKDWRFNVKNLDDIGGHFPVLYDLLNDIKNIGCEHVDSLSDSNNSPNMGM